MKKTICFVVTSRASFARVRTAIQACHDSEKITPLVVLAGSCVHDRYGDVRQECSDLGIHIHFECPTLVVGENPYSMAKTTAGIINDLAVVFQHLAIDGVVVVADRYETLAVSIAARYLNIPLIHIQGGELTGSIDDSVRWANTALASLHFVANDNAADRLFCSGQNPDTIYVTGCPAIDIAREHAYDDLGNTLMANPGSGIGAEIEAVSGEYAVVIFHPDTSDYGAGLDHGVSLSAERQMIEVLEAVAVIDRPTVLLWPNVDAGADGISKAIRKWINLSMNRTPIRVYKNFSSSDYIRLINHAGICIGNSSSFIREGAYLGVPAVVVGTRQSNRDHAANVHFVNCQHVEITDKAKEIFGKKLERSNLYGDGYAGKRIADVLETAELTVRKTLVL